jgi:peptide/nickel transport system permease protein
VFSLVVQRLASLVVTLLVLSVIVFAITQVLPGNVAYMILGPYATPDALAALEDKLQLHRPLIVQYLEWLMGFVSGHWGDSLRLGQPVAPILLLRLANSVYLALTALLMIVLLGIGLGIAAAVRRGTVLDHAISMFAFIGMSVPPFVLGALLIIGFGGGWLHILPGSGYVAPNLDPIGWLQHLVLPSITLMFMLLAYVLRMTRSSLVEVLRSNYVRTARLKGLSEQRVVLVHALRNALLPTTTVIAMNIGWLLGSVVIVEQVFAYPGIGSLMIFGIQNRDLPVLQASVMVVGVVTGLGNLVADLLYVYLNPRIRYGHFSS